MEQNSELGKLIFEVQRLMKYDEIQQELELAKTKYPTFPGDIFRQLAIIQKKVGDVTKSVLDYKYSDKCDLEGIEKELRQTAAMCVRMIESL
jgi:hypothetical protein